MKIACIQHVPFEGPANIESWALEQGHQVDKYFIFEKPLFPKLESFDLLLVMGGPQSAYEENLYSWLKTEKKLIEEAISKDKIVVGICLGAQLIADVLGARVYPAQEKEIGWFPVQTTDQALTIDRFKFLPKQFTPLHWHGDTFDLPTGSCLLASTTICPNQAFIYQQNILALQFHLEFAQNNLELMLHNAGSDLKLGPFIQSAEQIRSFKVQFEENYRLLEIFLNSLSQ